MGQRNKSVPFLLLRMFWWFLSYKQQCRSPQERRQCSQTWASGLQTQLVTAARSCSHFRCFCAALLEAWKRRVAGGTSISLSFLQAQEGKWVDERGSLQRVALNGSACKPALLEGVFPGISPHAPPSMCRSPFLSRGCWKMDLLPVHMYLYCQCIFILARFRRRFVGLSAQVGISRPVFNASESTRLCTPSSSFLSLFSSLSTVLTW